MLNPFKMKNLIILLQNYLIASYNFLTLFFIFWIKLYYSTFLPLNIFQPILNNALFATLIIIFFISAGNFQNNKLFIFKLNNFILTYKLKFLNLTNFLITPMYTFVYIFKLKLLTPLKFR